MSEYRHNLTILAIIGVTWLILWHSNVQIVWLIFNCWTKVRIKGKLLIWSEQKALFWIFRNTPVMFITHYDKSFLVKTWFSIICKMKSRIVVLGLFMLFVMVMSTSDTKERKKKSWKNKDNMMFMTDADAERLLEQWEVWPLHWILR